MDILLFEFRTVDHTVYNLVLLSISSIVTYNFIHNSYFYCRSTLFICHTMYCTLIQIDFTNHAHHIHNIRVYGMSYSYDTPILDSGANIHACENSATYRSQLGEEFHSTPVHITAAFGSEATVTLFGKYRLGKEQLTMRVIDSMKGAVVSVHNLCEGEQSSPNCVIFTADEYFIADRKLLQDVINTLYSHPAVWRRGKSRGGLYPIDNHGAAISGVVPIVALMSAKENTYWRLHKGLNHCGLSNLK